MPLATDQLIGVPDTLPLGVTQNSQQQLRNNFAMEYLHLRITGLVTLAGFTVAPAKRVESLENFLQSITLTATGNSSDTLCNVDGAFLRYKQRMLTGTDVTRTDIGTANGSYEVELNLKKFFIDPRSNAGKLTMLYSSLLSGLALAIQTRGTDAFATGGSGGTISISSFQVNTFTRQYLGRKMPAAFPYVKETQRTFDIQGSKNSYRAENVPRSNVLRRQYFKGMVGNTNYADPSDALFGATGKPQGPELSLKINNQATPLNTVYGALQADNKALFGVENLPAGYALYEPARDKRLANSLPMWNVNTADNFVDVNYTPGSINTLQITDEEIVKLTTAQYSAKR